MYKQGFDRYQFVFASLDQALDPNSEARVIDAFVDTLDLSNFKNSSPNNFGNRSYDPRILLKVYLLGYLRSIRSSRKLEYALSNNIEFIWIANGLKIKHTTIADFRKNNRNLLKPIMINFNLHLKNFDLISSFDSTDGTKIKAVNSKDNNFTLNKLDYRINRATAHIEEFERLFDAEDSSEEMLEDILNKIDFYSNKLDKFKKMQQFLVDNNLSQISLTDPDAKLMPNNGKFEVCYNNQVCVDMLSDIVKDFQVSNKPADLGSIHSISKEVKQLYHTEQDIVTNTTDKGYYQNDDMINCLEDGIIPEVTPQKDKDSFLLQTSYEENNITDDMKNSTNSEDIKKCLRAGVIPNVYKDKISNIEVKESTVLVDEDDFNDDNVTLEEKRNFAINNNCFVRSLKENLVFCPMGEILRKKSTNKNKIRYCNKLACKNCKNPCCSSKYKTVDFNINQIIINKKSNKVKKTKKVKKKIKTVYITLKCNKFLLRHRMEVSEHPHGSMKFWDNSKFLLTKGFEMVTGELALYYCAYNIRRAINLLGVNKLIAYFKANNNNNSVTFSPFFVNFRFFCVNSIIFLFFIILF